MEYWVANTDLQWFRYLAARAPVVEVNFWSPSTMPPKRLPQGARWIVKLANRNGGQIVGGAYFATFSAITPRFAWDAVGELNGAPDYPTFLRAISGYSKHVDGDATPVGCRRIREEFTNGRHYYSLDSHDVRLPLPPNAPRSREFLQWHADMVFKG